MSRPLMKVDTGASYTNSSGSLQTIIAVVNSCTDAGLQLVKFRIGFNGVTASNPPGIIRAYTTDGTANGTYGSAPTVTQTTGFRVGTVNLAGGAFASAEPTTKTYIDEFSLTPNGGTLVYDFPLGDEPEVGVKGTNGTVLGIDLSGITAVGVSAAMWFSRI